MSTNLTPDVIEAIETRVQRIKTDYEERLKADRNHQKAVFARLSWAIGVGFTVLAYFGVKGFDDLVERAIQKTFPRAEWEIVMQDVRDHALVQSLVIQGVRPTSNPANTIETEALRRLLINPTTRDQTFADVIAVLGRLPPKTMPPSILDTMSNLVKADSKEKFEWMSKHPARQEQLVLFLADHKYNSAAPAVLPLLDSAHRELQLAAIKYIRDCEVHAGIRQLSRIMAQRGTRGDVQSAAAVTLVSLEGNSPDAQKWLKGLSSQITTLDSAASTLVQVGVIADLMAKRQVPGFRRVSDAVAGSAGPQSPARQDPAEQAIVDILRSVLQNDYMLTLAKDREGRPLVYLAQDADKFSMQDIPPGVLSGHFVNLLLRQDLANKGALENFKRLVRGLSGIVTDRDVVDIRQEVMLYLGGGEIEFIGGDKLSLAAAADSMDQKIAAGWVLRNVKLSVSPKGELIAESASRMPSGVTQATGGKVVQSIRLGEDSVFSLRPVGDGPIAPERPMRTVTLVR